jgi:hypothetical protein
LPLDLVEQSLWDSRREGEHAPRIAARASRDGFAFAPKAPRANK